MFSNKSFVSKLSKILLVITFFEILILTISSWRAKVPIGTLALQFAQTKNGAEPIFY